jgi:hypothetical protein
MLLHKVYLGDSESAGQIGNVIEKSEALNYAPHQKKSRNRMIL